MRKRGRLIAVIGLIAFAGAIAAVFAWPNGSGAVREGGPLALPDEFSDAVGAPVKLGVPYSWGGVYLSNHGDTMANVDGITLVDRPPGMQVLGMYAVPPGRSSIGFLERYSPRGREVKDLTIGPGVTYQVIIGVRVDKPGSYLASAVRVHYRVGDVRYEDLFRQKLRLCAPFDAYEHCPVEPTPPS